MSTLTVAGHSRLVDTDQIVFNAWNPNQMSQAMYEKALESIRRFGFIDPVTVRDIGDDMFEAIDGEHRVRAARELRIRQIPIWDLGRVDDDDARELTIVLNETRGTPDRAKLAALLQDLAKRREEVQMRTLLPFDRQHFDDLIERRGVDWAALEEKREEAKKAGPRWTERVYRMPVEAAEVIDQAIKTVQAEDGVDQPWRALELICADYISGSGPS
jgi:ParB-like chromosome segregation protein Spo0J